MLSCTYQIDQELCCSSWKSHSSLQNYLLSTEKLLISWSAAASKCFIKSSLGSIGGFLAFEAPTGVTLPTPVIVCGLMVFPMGIMLISLSAGELLSAAPNGARGTGGCVGEENIAPSTESMEGNCDVEVFHAKLSAASDEEGDEVG